MRRWLELARTGGRDREPAWPLGSSPTRLLHGGPRPRLLWSCSRTRATRLSRDSYSASAARSSRRTRTRESPEPALPVAPYAWYWALGTNVAWGLTAVDAALWPVAVGAAAASTTSALPALEAPADAESIGKLAVKSALTASGDAMEKEALLLLPWVR